MLALRDLSDALFLSGMSHFRLPLAFAMGAPCLDALLGVRAAMDDISSLFSLFFSCEMISLRALFGGLFLSTTDLLPCRPRPSPAAANPPRWRPLSSSAQHHGICLPSHAAFAHSQPATTLS